MAKFKSGFVTIIGRTNVGKSTLMNSLAKEKVAITTNKCQTTRTAIKAIINRENSQIIFIDTPGIHKPKTKLNENMIELSWGAIEDSDVVLFLVEANSKEVGRGDSKILEKLKESNKKCILIINKIDLVDKEELAKFIDLYKNEYEFEAIIPISAKKEKYNDVIKKDLMEKFNYASVMEVPKLEKIVINIGVGDATTNSKLLEAAVHDLELISGQKPVITKARKSIAGFKVREGQSIGCKVTLRGENMYNFLDKLVTIGLPRVRDFHGVSSKAFDGRGNYTLGIKEQLIFSEIEYDNVVKVRGMDIVFVTTAKTNEEAYDLLAELGIPFRK